MNLICGNPTNSNTTQTSRTVYACKKSDFCRPFYDLNIKQYFDESTKDPLPGIKIARLYENQNLPVMKHHRQHKHANDKDYVAMPKNNLKEQMVSMISITGGYEANATAPKTAKDVALKALKRGR